MTARERLERAIEAAPDGLDLDLPHNLALYEAAEAERHARLLEQKEQALQSGDWDGYLMLFGSHERLEGLLHIADEIEDAERYWRCVTDTWILCDAPGLAEDDWRYLFTDVYCSGKASMMSEAERTALAELPDPVPVFRGFTRDGGERGFSWTLDRKRAEWFALEFHNGPRMEMLFEDAAGGHPRLAVGCVAKRDLIALLLEREEREVLALPEDVAITVIERLDAP